MPITFQYARDSHALAHNHHRPATRQLTHRIFTYSHIATRDRATSLALLHTRHRPSWKFIILNGLQTAVARRAARRAQRALLEHVTATRLRPRSPPRARSRACARCLVRSKMPRPPACASCASGLCGSRQRVAWSCDTTEHRARSAFTEHASQLDGHRYTQQSHVRTAGAAHQTYQHRRAVYRSAASVRTSGHSAI